MRGTPIEAAVDLDSVAVVENGRLTLRDVTWTLGRGEHAAVLGPNGSGKTTLVRLLALHRHATRGRVEILGLRVGRDDVRSLRRRVGVVSDAYQDVISDRVPIRWLVAAALRAITAPTPGDVDDVCLGRADQALALVEMEALGDRPGRELSAGEWKRALLARALVAEPELLVLDEPCAGLDLAQREKFLDTLEAVISRPDGPSSIMVTHHLEEIVPSVGKALVMVGGSVAASGPLDSTITGDVLGQAFGVGIEVTRNGDRLQATHFPLTRERRSAT